MSKELKVPAIERAFPARKARGRSPIATFRDDGKSAGKQRFGLVVAGANGQVIFQTHPEKLSTPAAMTKHLRGVHAAIGKLLDAEAGGLTVRHEGVAPA